MTTPPGRKNASPAVFIVMGVSGAGKSTIAEAMIARLHWPHQEGDALHPPNNIQKMHAGIPLTDEDRAPWLRAVKRWIDRQVKAGEPGLVTCSALRRTYRDFLVAGRPSVRLLYLEVDRTVLEQRLARRTGHYMPPSLLDSKLSTLERPEADERPIVVSARGSVDETVSAALAALDEGAAAPAPATPVSPSSQDASAASCAAGAPAEARREAAAPTKTRAGG